MGQISNIPSSIGNSQNSGKGGNTVTTPTTSQQPSFGVPNQYPNTVGQWDNAQIAPQPSSGGKSGKAG